MTVFYRITRFLLLFLLVTLYAGCAIPIGVTRISTVDSYKQSITNPLMEGKPGNATRVVAEAPDYFLLSAIYAYLYILGDGKEPPPSAWDIRFRQACDLYNRALARGFPAGDG